ncbi:DUF5709 domain-containing protein [Streptomyces sp. NBC_01477]|uniref:DUF5709 domain-containing protein n=1 Tax=Streptomyces sp. NBC_01477 TaxID=2976015 RepID=UPI002E35BA7B|nr:DUF5709 domain-containing protein [Streptomyces sp. NBC_01477]
MTDDARGDEVYQPTGSNEEQEDASPLDMEDAVGEDDYDTMLDRGYSPPERPYAVDKPGTTAAEQREGENLDERLSEEVPDVGDRPQDLDGDPLGDAPGTDGELVDQEAGDERSGRLVAPNQGIERPVHDGVAATDVGIDDASAPAEEAAVHEVDDPERGGTAP